MVANGERRMAEKKLGLADRTTIGCMLLFLLGGVVMMSFFFLSVINRGVEAFQLSLGDRRIIQATVIKPGLPSDPSSYEFQVNGVSYRGLAGGEARGETVKVAYLLSDPAVNRPADDLIFDMLMGAGLPLGLLIGFLFIFWPRAETVADVLQSRRIDEQMRLAMADDDDEDFDDDEFDDDELDDDEEAADKMG